MDDLNSSSGLPATGWNRFVPLAPSHWSEESVKSSELPSFSTQSVLGEVALDGGMPEWTLGLSKDDKYNRSIVYMLCNGFSITPESSPDETISVFCAGPGILVGRVPEGVTPEFFTTDHEIQRKDDCASVSGTNYHAVLLQNENRFALAVDAGSVKEAEKSARASLKIDPEQALKVEFQKRQAYFGAAAKAQDKVLCAHALEHSIRMIRQPSGAYKHTYAATDGTNFNHNDLYSLTQLWLMIDPERAKDLIRAVLDTQEENGRIPQTLTDEGPTEESTWPLLVRCIELIWQATGDESFASETLGAAGRFLTWCVEYNTEDTGHLCWQDPDESFIAELWDKNVEAVDLYSILLSEATRLVELSETVDIRTFDTTRLSPMIASLSAGLESLWSDEENRFSNRFVNGEAIKRDMLSNLFPLLWSGLDNNTRVQLGDGLEHSRGLPGDQGLRSWEKWFSDEHEPPIDATMQLIALDFLNHENTRRPYDQLRNRLTSQYDGMETLVYETGDIGALALLLSLHFHKTTDEALYSNYPRIVTWIDEHRFSLMTFSAAMGFISLISVIVLFVTMRTDLGGSQQEAMTQTVQQNYDRGSYDEAIDLLHTMIEHSRAPATINYLNSLLANAHFQKGEYETAADLYRQIIEGDDDNAPKAQFNLAQALYRMDKFEDSKKELTEFIEYYGEDFPHFKVRAELALSLIKDHRTRDL